MARVTVQENPDGGASRDACDEQPSSSANNSNNHICSAIHTSTMSSREQSGQSPSRPSYNDSNRIGNSIGSEIAAVDASLRHFPFL
jgi:hypothetical protein